MQEIGIISDRDPKITRLERARDAIDRRIIDDEKAVGGYPTLTPTQRVFVEGDWDLATMMRRDSRPS